MAKKKLSEDEISFILRLDASETQQEIHKTVKANKELIESNKALQKQMTDLIGAGKKESDEFKNLSSEFNNNRKAIEHNNSLIGEMEKKLGLTTLTMAQLRNRAKLLQSQLNHTSKALEPEEYGRLEKELIDVRTRMDELRISGKKTGEALQESLGDTILSQGKLATFFGNMYTKAVEWAGEAIIKVKEFITEGNKMAGMAQGIERAFNRISTPGKMDELRTSTKGMVNDLKLMQSAVKANNFKIPLEELGTLLRFAQQRAQETGESVEYLTESIVTGIGRQSPLILDNLGISAVKLREEVAKTGDFAKAVGIIVREELSKSGTSIDTAADKAQQRAVLLQNIQLSIGQRMIGMVESVGSAWTSFLDVINRWVSIPTVDKLRDEQRETNILAHSIMAAEGRTEARNLLIQEMQRQYPSFLANLDTEKLTNEQLAERLKDVNGEYENRIRIQVMNDKALKPLKDKQQDLIEDEIESIQTLNKLTENWGSKMSDSFKEAINSGDVLKMSTKDIWKEINAMNLGARSGVGLVIASNIARLKEIPSELKVVEKEIKETTDRISSFGKPNESSTGQLQPLAKEISMFEHLKSLRKQAADEMKESTYEEITAKNKVLKYYDDEIARLNTLGIEKEKKKKNPYEDELKAVDQYVTQERVKLNENYLQKLTDKDEYNQQLEMLELEALNRRMEIYQLDQDKQIEILDKIQAYKIKILEQAQKFEASQEKYRDKLEKKEKKKKEKALNDELKRIVTNNNEKQAEEYAEQQKHQEKLKELALGFSNEIGTILGGVIAGNNDLVKSSLVSILNMGLDSLEIIVQLAAAQAIAEGGGKGGLIGMAKGAVVAGLIKAAFSAVKAIVSSSINNIGGKSVSTGNSTLPSGSRVTTGLQSGGYLDVTRAQDGKGFNAIVEPEKRGFVDKPTVIVGDGPVGKSREWVASNDALQNPTVVPFINVLNESQEKGEIRTVDMNQLMRKRLAGFESGGSISIPVSEQSKSNQANPQTTNPVESGMLNKLYSLLQKIDKEGGVKAYIIYSEFQKQQARLEESRKIGSKS